MPRQTQSLALCAEENAGLLEKPRIRKDTRQDLENLIVRSARLSRARPQHSSDGRSGLDHCFEDLEACE